MLTFFKDRKPYDVTKFAQYFDLKKPVEDFDKKFAELEKKLGYQFNSNYKRFLYLFGGASLKSEQYSIKFMEEIPFYANDFSHLEILSINMEDKDNIWSAWQHLLYRIPKNKLPIGIIDNQNYLVFDKRFGEICVHLHDHCEGVFKIQDCLKELLEAIYQEDNRYFDKEKLDKIKIETTSELDEAAERWKKEHGEKNI